MKYSPEELSSTVVCVFLTVAGHLSDSDRESADSSSHLGLPVPDGQYLLAGVVVFQPVGPLAAARSAFPDMLRDVRLYGCRLHR